jgi:hypothetical protein
MTTITQLKSENQALVERIAQLEATLAGSGGDGASESNKLVQRLWINGSFTTGQTRASGLKLSFSGQYSSLDKQSGRRNYGGYKNFVAYGAAAEAARAIYEGKTRLVNVEAFERPWSDNSKKSEWVILSITAYDPEYTAPVSAGEAVPADEPVPDYSTEGVPF